VSDASGQIVTSTDAGGGFASPLSRSNSVLMQRVRQEQFARLDAAYKGGLLKGMMFLHLKRDLDVQPVDWLGCEEPSEQVDAHHVAESLTSYRIRKEVQNLLAGIRTDLDGFSDAEAFALMTSGYRMAERFLPEVKVLPKVPPKQFTWPFLEIEKVMSSMTTIDRRYIRLKRLLQTGSCRLFRAFRQSPLPLGFAIVGFACLALLLWRLALSLPPTISLSFSRGGLLISLIAVGSLIGALASPRVREHASRIGLAFLAIAIWLPLMLHLHVIDRSFLRMGKLRRLL
jgi:hypothetical protein